MSEPNGTDEPKPTYPRVIPKEPKRPLAELPWIVALGECAICGLVHTRCTAHMDKHPQIPCKNAAIKGGTVCRRHGAMLPQAIKARESRIRDQKAAATLRRLVGPEPGPPIDDPGRALEALAGQVWSFNEGARRLVADLGDEVTVSTRDGIDIHPVVKLAERVQDRLAVILTSMAKLGLHERRVLVDEAQGRLVFDVVSAALNRVTLPDGMAEQLRAELATEFRFRDALAANAVPVETDDG